MSIYPIIKLPRAVKQAYAAEPIAPPFQTQAPLDTATLITPQRFNLPLLAGEASLLSLSSGILGLGSQPVAALVIWLVGMALILAQAQAMESSYAERWRQYREQVDRQGRQQWEQDFLQARWERLQTPEGIAQYRRRRISELLSTSAVATPKLPLDIPERELYVRLARQMDRHFPQCIHLHVGSGLMFIDRRSNLHISIAIDTKPQTIAGTAAGSFLEDDWYLEQGWMVARFTATQATQAPDSCAKAIAEICTELLQDKRWVEPLKQTPDLWTLTPTAHMAVA